MNAEDASKLLTEMGLDPDAIVTTNIRMRDMLMLNELVDSAIAWKEASFYADVRDDTLTTRLVEAIDAYMAADKRAQADS